MDGPSTFEIFGHMRQLQPIIHKNADVVHALATSFVGAYGEWHSSVHKLEQNVTGAGGPCRAELDWFLPAIAGSSSAPRPKASLLRSWAALLPPGRDRDLLDWCIAGPRLNQSASDNNLAATTTALAQAFPREGHWASPCDHMERWTTRRGSSCR